MNDDVMVELLGADAQMYKAMANIQLPDPYLLNYYKDAEKRMHFVEGDITDDTIELANIIMRYNLMDKGKPVEERKPIYIYINSLGGDVSVTWTIVNLIRISKTPVYTVAYHTAMSAAAYILVAGHKRYATPGATILVHSGSCSFTGDVDKVESAKKYYDGMSQKINAFLLSRSKILQKDLKRKGVSDWYMTAEEALERGIVDEVITDIDTILPQTEG